MNTIKKFREVVSADTAPRDRNVMWVDTFDEDNPIIKVYLEGKWVPIIGSGGNINPEILEKYMPLSREFSNEFSDDFAR